MRRRREERENREHERRFQNIVYIYENTYIHGCVFPRHTFTHSHTHTHTHTNVNLMAVISTLPSRFPPILTLFFSLEQFFLIELKNTHIHRHTYTYVFPSGGDAFLFRTWKAFVRYLIPCRKKRKMKQEWKRKIYYIRREERELIMKEK